MAYMFRSLRMIIVSLIPNLLPLLITAGLMGYLGVPIKPSTILVFSIAFGISVDDTIHFLAKYRQELHSKSLENTPICLCRFARNWSKYVLHIHCFIFWVFRICIYQVLEVQSHLGALSFNNPTICHASQFITFAIVTSFS